jgi:hypothetical protein
MPEGYESPFPNIASIFDELVAAGRKPDQAAREMISAIRDGVLILIDRSDLSRDGGSAATDACRFLEAYLDRLAGVRNAGNPYMAASVKNIGATREQIESVFRLGVSASATKLAPKKRGPSPTAKHINAKSAGDLVKNYISSAVSPSKEGARLAAIQSGIRGARPLIDAEYNKQMSERGIAVARGRRPKQTALQTAKK